MLRNPHIGEGVLSPTEPVEEISAEEFWQLLYSRIAKIHSGEVDFPVGEDVPNVHGFELTAGPIVSVERIRIEGSIGFSGSVEFEVGE